MKGSISFKAGSEFFNARLMAWEPLMEQWGASLELELGIGKESEPMMLTLADGGKAQQELPIERDSRGGKWNAAFSTHDLPEQAVTKQGENQRARLNIGVRLVSSETLNVNFTESLVENLAAIVHAQQRKQGTLEGTWAGGGNGDDSFSLHWLRNETGLPILCSASCKASGDKGAPLPVQVKVGEEAPMPSLGAVFDSRADGTIGSGEKSDDGGVDSVTAELNSRIATANRDPSGVAECEVIQTKGATVADTSIPLPRQGLNRCLSGGSSSKSPIGRHRLSKERKMWTAAIGQVMKTVGRRRRKRRCPVRTVVLELQEEGRQNEQLGAMVSTTSTTWRSLRPVDVDILGQRLTTMVVSPYSFSNGDTEAAPESFVRSSGSLRWAKLVDAARNAKTVKVVTEVESHHGVKVTFYMLEGYCRDYISFFIHSSFVLCMLSFQAAAGTVLFLCDFEEYFVGKYWVPRGPTQTQCSRSEKALGTMYRCIACCRLIVSSFHPLALCKERAGTEIRSSPPEHSYSITKDIT